MRLPFFIMIPVILLGVLAFQRFSDHSFDEKTQRPAVAPAGDGRLHIWPADFSRNELASFLQESLHSSRHFSTQVAFEKKGTSFAIETTIDESLQKYVSRLLGWSRTHQAAEVVVAADDRVRTATGDPACSASRVESEPTGAAADLVGRSDRAAELHASRRDLLEGPAGVAAEQHPHRR